MGRVTHYDTVQMLAHLLSQRENVAKYYVTVTAGQTHTINSLGVSAATIVDWGDGLSNEYTGTDTRTHVYASTGTYCVKIYTPENVLTFDLRDGAAVSVLNSADLKGMANISNFSLRNLPSASITLNSADMVDWRVSGTFYLHTLTSASITLNSTDMVDWRPGSITLTNIPSATITLNSADMVDWRLRNFTLYNLPSVTITIAPSTIKNWSTATTIDLRTRNLTQQQADLVLWECYQIARTDTSGTIRLDIAGNASPSGTFQACQSPPVSSSTPGKEIAYELLNDSLGVGFNKWATVLTN